MVNVCPAEFFLSLSKPDEIKSHILRLPEVHTWKRIKAQT
jgi:hypothetical protein